jgi:hypothetical protein
MLDELLSYTKPKDFISLRSRDVWTSSSIDRAVASRENAEILAQEGLLDSLRSERLLSITMCFFSVMY